MGPGPAAPDAQIRWGVAAHTALNAFAPLTRGASRFAGEIAREPGQVAYFLRFRSAAVLPRTAILIENTPKPVIVHFAV